MPAHDTRIGSERQSSKKTAKTNDQSGLTHFTQDLLLLNFINIKHDFPVCISAEIIHIKKGVKIMPRYEFYCRDCEKDFMLEMHVDEYEKNKDSQKCPECGSANVKRKVTGFETQTSKKS